MQHLMYTTDTYCLVLCENVHQEECLHCFVVDIADESIRLNAIECLVGDLPTQHKTLLHALLTHLAR